MSDSSDSSLLERIERLESDLVYRSKMHESQVQSLKSAHEAEIAQMKSVFEAALEKRKEAFQGLKSKLSAASEIIDKLHAEREKAIKQRENEEIERRKVENDKAKEENEKLKKELENMKSQEQEREKRESSIINEAAIIKAELEKMKAARAAERSCSPTINAAGPLSDGVKLTFVPDLPPGDITVRWLRGFGGAIFEEIEGCEGLHYVCNCEDFGANIKAEAVHAESGISSSSSIGPILPSAPLIQAVHDLIKKGESVWPVTAAADGAARQLLANKEKIKVRSGGKTVSKAVWSNTLICRADSSDPTGCRFFVRLDQSPASAFQLNAVSRRDRDGIVTAVKFLNHWFTRVKSHNQDSLLAVALLIRSINERINPLAITPVQSTPAKQPPTPKAAASPRPQAAGRSNSVSAPDTAAAASPTASSPSPVAGAASASAGASADADDVDAEGFSIPKNRGFADHGAASAFDSSDDEEEKPKEKPKEKEKDKNQNEEESKVTPVLQVSINKESRPIASGDSLRSATKALAIGPGAGAASKGKGKKTLKTPKKGKKKAVEGDKEGAAQQEADNEHEGEREEEEPEQSAEVAKDEAKTEAGHSAPDSVTFNLLETVHCQCVSGGLVKNYAVWGELSAERSAEAAAESLSCPVELAFAEPGRVAKLAPNTQYCTPQGDGDSSSSRFQLSFPPGQSVISVAKYRASCPEPCQNVEQSEIPISLKLHCAPAGDNQRLTLEYSRNQSAASVLAGETLSEVRFLLQFAPSGAVRACAAARPKCLWSTNTQKLMWNIPQLAPGESGKLEAELEVDPQTPLQRPIVANVAFQISAAKQNIAGLIVSSSDGTARLISACKAGTFTVSTADEASEPAEE